MREYIFTQLEREILSEYLKNGTKKEGLRTLLTRIRQHKKTLQRDYDLLSQVLEK